MAALAAGQSEARSTIRPRIGVGFRVGRLTVEEATERRKDNYIVWRCRCDCGGEIELDTRWLQRGAITDCGCISGVRPRKRDITGMRFGMLVALEPTGEAVDRSAVWRCRCDCGGEVNTTLHQLRAGYRKSCGCLSHPARKDYVGKRFGQLTVTGYAGKWGGTHRWRCLCDCGKETVVNQTLLQSGKTKSCGCLQVKAYRDNLKLFEGTSVTLLERRKNQLLSSNTSGYTGVYFNQKRGVWAAQITFKGKTYYLGSYASKQEAVKARQRGEEMHDSFLEWYYENHPKPAPSPAAE